jgi:hypothetical protein
MLPDSCQRVGSISVTNDVEEKEWAPSPPPTDETHLWS